MYHYFNAITNTKGDALIGYFVRAVDPTSGSGVSIYADESATPIISVSGVADACQVDADGNASFYIAGGTYDLDIYATDSTSLVRRIESIPMVDFTVAAGNVASRSALAAKVAPTSGDSYTLVETAREGLFVFDSADNSANVTADPGQGVYVAPSSDTTGASGAWVRRYTGSASVKWFGALGDGATDDTTAVQRAFNLASRVHIPAGTFIASSLTIPANTEVTTDGFDSIIKQKSGTATSTRLISITGSNVHVGDLSVEGQLNQAGDTTGEQNHAIFIYIAAADTASRSNITIGNVKGTNIRGDVVCTGVHPTAYTAGYRLTGISIGKVVGSNVYRNVVSITGGSDISVESATGTQVGYFAFDAEPDVGSGPITGLRVGYIKGRACQFAGPAAADYIGAWVGFIDVDPSYTTTSSPDYGLTQYQNGLSYRNCKSLRIERLYANGHYGQAVLPVTGALARQEISFGNVEIPTSCTTETTNACYIMGDATTYMTIDVLAATTTAAVTNQCVFKTCTNTVVKNAQISLAPASQYMRSCTDCITDNINVSRASGNGGTIDLSGTRCHYRGGTQLCDYFFSFSTRCTAMGVDATAASGYDNSGTTNTFYGSKIGATFVYFNDQTSAVAINILGDAALHQVSATDYVKSSSATAGIGYATGAGGTVTQATSKATGVTLNKVCGEITLNNAALAAGTIVSFTLTNSAIAAGDRLVLNHVSGGTLGAYALNAASASGSATIYVRNATGGSLSEAIVIGFAVVKATTA